MSTSGEKLPGSDMRQRRLGVAFVTGRLRRPDPGEVLVLADEQYRFGVGPLLSRVVSVLGVVGIDAEPWWHLRGECARGTPE